MPDFHFYEPRQGHGLPHDPFKAIVAPRPIGWISSMDEQGRVNLAPYSFFNAFSESPPIIGFSSGGRKDSQRNIEATGEFVANLAMRKHAEAMNRTSAPVPHGINEMEVAGLAAAPSILVKPPARGRRSGRPGMQTAPDFASEGFGRKSHSQYPDPWAGGRRSHRQNLCQKRPFRFVACPSHRPVWLPRRLRRGDVTF